MLQDSFRKLAARWGEPLGETVFNSHTCGGINLSSHTSTFGSDLALGAQREGIKDGHCLGVHNIPNDNCLWGITLIVVSISLVLPTFL